MSTRRRWSLFPATFGAALALWVADAAPAAGQSNSPEEEKELVLGTWQLVAEKSTYNPGPKPKSQTRVYEAHPDGVKATIDTVFESGRTAKVEYVAKSDGIEYPVTGSTQVDALTLKRVNRYIAEAVLMHARTTIGAARRVISEDGKTMTLTLKLTYGSEPAIDNVQVYERVK